MGSRANIVVASLCGAFLIHIVIAGCSENVRTLTVAQADQGQAPSRTITADTDRSQLRYGFAPAGTVVEKVADGPFILSDAVVQGNGGNGTTTFFAANGTVCPSTPTNDIVLFVQQGGAGVSALNGARYFTASGKALCVTTGAGVSWAGFVPYPQ